MHHTSLALKRLGLKPGQILGYYGPTSIASVVLLLAASSIGAIWSSTASDFGALGVRERFEQFGAELWGVVGCESVVYNGKRLPQRAKLEEVVKGLKAQEGRDAPLEVVIFDFLGEGLSELPQGWRTLDEVEELGRQTKEDEGLADQVAFAQLPFDHSLWILFSSGTTGAPKAIVHRAGGQLLQELKEHLIHGGMGPESVFFQYTTPGWMMYNYLVSGLCSGGTVVLFDGSPLHQPGVLWDLAEDLGVTVFGTSAKYLDVLAKGYSPKAHHQLEKLEQVLSTGSPLSAERMGWAYEHVKTDLLVGSITGGTDICSLFAGHNVALPVFEGEIQCLALGQAVEAWSDEGENVPRGVAGELMCVKPFPAMPVAFWADEDGRRYKASYFDKFEGVWAHGDYCVVTPSQAGNGGGLVMLGRSDGVLNPQGIRFGSSELYDVMASFSPDVSASGAPNPLHIVVDSLVVGQKIDGGLDERVVLFVQLAPGHTLDPALEREIKARIRAARSARHVPARIVQVQDVPHTVNGKKVEVPIKKVLAGEPVAAINKATLRNPECLVAYEELGVMLRKEVA